MAQAEGPDLPPPVGPVAVSGSLAARDAEADLALWRDRLAGAEPTPLGGRAAAGPARATARQDRRIAAAPLLAFARQAGVTPATLVAAAWGLALADQAGRDEAVFGMTSSGRPADLPGAETAVGLFLTVLPVRLAIDAAAAPAAFLRRLQTDLAALRAHERCPPADLLAAAGLPAGTTLATSLFTYENYPTDPSLAAPRAQGPRIAAVQAMEQSSFPLSLLAGLEGEAMLLSLRHDPARFTAAEAARRLDQVAALLAGFATAATLGALLPRGGTEGFEAGPAIDHGTATLHALVLAQAARTPAAPAVLWGGTRMTYAALAARARGVAGALQAAGVARGDVVGLAAERGEALLPALLGILMAGAAWCPLEPDQPAPRRAAMAAAARLRVVLCGPGIAAPEGCAGLPLDAAADAATLPALAGADTAYVLFTSGSTGRPKGVAVSHAAIVNRLAWMQRAYPIGASDRVLQKTPLGFDVCVWELFWALTAGAAVVVAPPGAHRDPDALAAEMRARDVGVLHFVPSMLRAFLDTPGIAARCGTPRLVFTSGEALTPDLVAAWRRHFAAPLHNLYGPTEAAVDVTAWPCGAAEAAGEVPIGRPVDNVVARVLDGAMRRVPAGAQGGLWLGGVQLATGYVGAPALTADAFRPDPFGAPGARLYRTGDVASWRVDGALLYRGRSDAQVKLRGVRIETGEVEAALLAHPDVREAAVRLVGDRLVAWVAPGVPPDIDAVLAARLPAAMRPAALVPVARMPLTPSGKLDRRALAEPAPVQAVALPRGALELRVAALAGQVLGTVPGPQDDLLALGLHSLAAVRLANLLRREFGAAPGLGALHAAPNVAALAGALAGVAQPASPLVRLRGGAGRALVLVHPLGGDVACFLRLAVRCDRPVLALQSRGLLGGEPAASIEAMAEDYVAALRDAAPGPVTLAGYSMGCAVAFEMARRLGADLHRLVLLDGAAGGAGDALPDAALSLDQARAQGLLPEGFSPEQAARLRDVAQANQRALASWRPAPADLAATLLRTDPAAGDFGWGAVALGGVAIHDIAAAHAALLDEPHVAAVAAILQEASA
ncbi:D-alanine--D-alanyl carrier protein ligase [Roseomonas sp. CECT 9278]|nr:D-alanine--D-alanyl carrier protein ligase [Roseomonas sp. CECT 9278]